MLGVKGIITRYIRRYGDTAHGNSVSQRDGGVISGRKQIVLPHGIVNIAEMKGLGTSSLTEPFEMPESRSWFRSSRLEATKPPSLIEVLSRATTLLVSGFSLLGP